MDQQHQTLEYFKSHADDWNRKSTSEAYSVIENRHNAVLEIMKDFPTKSNLLDVGCGTGQLAIEASRLGWGSTGIDFAQEMVDLCIENNAKAGTGAAFSCSSIFEAKLTDNSYDVVSAQGFIEYISLEQLNDFLQVVQKTLKKGGSIALGSRNRLFNLHAFNSFTELENSLGTINNLINEAIILQTAPSQEVAIEKLAELSYEYEQPKAHPITGVKVDTRYQFSPADLITKLRKNDFEVEKICPVHFHPLPVTMLPDELGGEVHKELAKLASNKWIANQKLVPYSSSFVIQANKI